MKTKILGLLAVGLLAGPMAASAVPISWKLNAVFNDHSSISGTFVFDADTSVFSGINVTSSNGNSYFQVNPESGGNSGFLSFLAGPWEDGTPYFTAELAAGMTNAGGTIAIVPGFVFSGGTGFSFEGACASSDGENPCRRIAVLRDIASGRITTVPEPGTLALLGLGLAGLGLSRRRKAA